MSKLELCTRHTNAWEDNGGNGGECGCVYTGDIRRVGYIVRFTTTIHSGVYIVVQVCTCIGYMWCSNKTRRVYELFSTVATVVAPTHAFMLGHSNSLV